MPEELFSISGFREIVQSTLKMAPRLLAANSLWSTEHGKMVHC